MSEADTGEAVRGFSTDIARLAFRVERESIELTLLAFVCRTWGTVAALRLDLLLISV